MSHPSKTADYRYGIDKCVAIVTKCCYEDSSFKTETFLLFVKRYLFEILFYF